MAIIRMVRPDDNGLLPDDAFESSTYPGVFLQRYAEGCVVSEREANSYHDSDFYATYWDTDTETFREVCFASTRGWTYPCMATRVDATPEITARWQAELDLRDRQARVSRRLRDRQRDLVDKAKADLPTRFHVRRLRWACGRDRYDTALRLLATRKQGTFRSDFRRSLAEQVYAWALDLDAKHASPLSPKQWSYV